jgi:F-box protein 9
MTKINFFRPWHFVEYYRYLRFFLDGQVLFLTSSEEPGVSVPGLREKSPRNQATLKGTYEMYGGSNISCVVTSLPPPTSGFSNKSKKSEVQQQTSFHLEFKIFPVKGHNTIRHNWMLKWTHHAVFIKSKPNSRNVNRQNQDNSPRSTVTSTAFELSPNKYPPILFSRVKSYTTGPSESILE